MTSRFFHPAKVAASALIFLLVAGGHTVFSQTAPTPTPSATPKPKRAYLRFWNLLPSTSSEPFELIPAAEPKGAPFRTAPPSNFGAGYEDVIPGRYVLNLCRSTERDKPLKTFDVTLANNDYVSIVVHSGTSAAGTPEAELTTDSIQPDQPVDNRLTVYQSLQGARVTVSAARTQVTEPLTFGAVQTLKNLPKGLVPLSVSISSSNNRPIRSGAEADFTYAHRATMLIIQDGYGRIRPYVISDGPSNVPEETPAPTTSPAPKPTPTPSKPASTPN